MVLLNKVDLLPEPSAASLGRLEAYVKAATGLGCIFAVHHRTSAVYHIR